MSRGATQSFEIRLAPWRARLVLILLIAGLVVLTGRALFLQGWHNEFLRQKGESRYSRVIEISATRGMILDRNKEPLAISTPVESVAASPADVEVTTEQMRSLAAFLGTPLADVAKRLSDTHREFVYLKRQLPDWFEKASRGPHGQAERAEGQV